MKKLIVSLMFVLTALGAARAQSNIALLDKVAGQRVHFHYTYSLSQKGQPFKEITDGNVVVEDNAYSLEGLGIKVISDGETRWSLDEAAREVVVETVEEGDLFTNPALFIASYRRYMDKIKVNAEGLDYLDVTLTLDEDKRARFVLRSIVFGERKEKSDFRVDLKSLPKDYLVTDLR
jgi:hypothetical protein